MSQYVLPKEKVIKNYKISKPNASNPDGYYSIETTHFFTGKDILFIMAALAVTVVSIVWLTATRAQVTGANQQIQSAEYQTKRLETEKKNLQQEINDLSSYNRVMEFAKDNGFKLNEENIRNVANEPS
ncbi:cell division protein FtsL [Aerococcus christensenii]|uniref:Cell division protein FtsL n=2 Tax=Aerococcus christensenii TaxID=87541 RepID=A0A109RC20_9LACT|nr:cell division protein FtsL [Aerococcus christensenii]AMB91989.1 hypothetical protein AWM71_00875 [Aerococcus christensenii]KXB36454.1 cell division protein FtsL [Aerococcus christensenii]MDK8234354.1 cell division protein FtsL [Aerococcus christensenii]WEB70511.1 cell division protein FtsL [Aerococcus christensenii]